MWSHLKAHHPSVYEEAHKKKDAAASSASVGKVQATLTHIFDTQRKWPNSDPRSKAMDTLIAEMIATDNQPFTVVSDVGFKRLLAVAEPRYNLKNEKYYRMDVLTGVYTKVTDKIRQLIAPENAGPHLAFTTNCWSGDAESLISLTCHFIDKNWERKQVMLNVKAMFGSHTGESILVKCFWTCLTTGIFREKEWCLCSEMVVQML